MLFLMVSSHWLVNLDISLAWDFSTFNSIRFGDFEDCDSLL